MSRDERSMPTEFSIPGTDGDQQFAVSRGSTTTFCGANGSGKTRLAVHIEQQLGLKAHRISAHRALSLNPRVPKISETEARRGLRTGAQGSYRAGNEVHYRQGNRWQGQEATWLLNDYDYLVQALFAEQANTALESHKTLRAGPGGTAKLTKFEKLSEIWDRLLPHRKLDITGDDISVETPGNATTYAASELSDGERALFYLVGQTLVADEESVLVIDEPELHLHPAIMTLLWDELGAARPDCAFVFITHSLDFAAARPGDKYVVHAVPAQPCVDHRSRTPRHRIQRGVHHVDSRQPAPGALRRGNSLKSRQVDIRRLLSGPPRRAARILRRRNPRRRVNAG